MPTWNQLLEEVKSAGSTYDIVRKNYLRKLYDKTGRNVIAYYSGWLQKEDYIRQGVGGFEVNDNDKNGLMATIHETDRKLGLDLILHTPGGSVAATESIVDYLRSMFDGDIRVIVPQIAMSAGTMIACAARSIIMGKHSSLGPIDPQINGIPAHGIVEEFIRAAEDIKRDPIMQAVWGPILSKYSPAFIGECEKAIHWSEEIVEEWLVTGMFSGHADAEVKAKFVVAELGDHALTKSHSRHISFDKAKEIGLHVERLEDVENKELQDKVLSVHHSCILTLSATPVTKIIENHLGVGYIQQVTVGR